MRWRVLLGAVGVVVLAAIALGRSSARRPETPAAPRPAPAPRADPVPPPVTVPAAIRDVFRFAEGPASPAHAASDRPREARENAPPSPPPAGPRLVGLLIRSGRLMAALAADGEVELAGPGDTVGGVTVLAVSEEGVRVRRPDGSEETLPLP